MFNREQMVAEIAKEVVARLQAHMNGGASRHGAAAVPATDGIFETVDEAVKAAAEAQKKVEALSLEDRGRIISIIRGLCESRKQEFGKLELDETGPGPTGSQTSETRDRQERAGRRGHAVRCTDR